MKPRDDRILRLILGALVSAELAPRDLFAISERLNYDQRLLDRLSFLLRRTAEALDSLERSHGSREHGEAVSDLAAEVVRLIGHRRLPKKDALRILSSLGGSSALHWQPRVSATLRQNVESLFESVSVSQRQELISELAAALNLSTDPFLRELAR